MTTIPTAAIELLWFEPGCAADAAVATRAANASLRAFGAADVREIWRKAQAEGRLPAFRRPEMGFAERQRKILKQLATGRKSA